MIVDDEPALLKMMSVYLSRLGYEVSALESTDRAWREVKAAPETIALAVLDASMPGLGMEELAFRILGSSSRVCVIAASGYPVDMSAMEAAAPGRVAFLHKPFAPEKLAAEVRRMLGSQEAEV